MITYKSMVFFFQGITVWKCVVYIECLLFLRKSWQPSMKCQSWNEAQRFQPSAEKEGKQQLYLTVEQGFTTFGWWWSAIFRGSSWMAATSQGGASHSFRRTFADSCQLLKDSTRGKLKFFDWTPGSPFPSYNHFFQREQFHVFPPELYLFLLCLNTFVLPMGLIH